MSRIFLLLLFCLLSFQASAATCTAKASDNWSKASTWSCGAAPAAGDTVSIPSSYSVTLNTDSAAIGSLTVSGTLTTSGNTSRVLYLAGPLVNDGTITLTAGTSGIFVSAASAWSGNGALTADYINVNTAAMTWATGSTMNIYLLAATPIVGNNGFNNGGTPNSTGYVYLNGSTQTMSAYSVNFPNLTISSGTTTVSASTLTVLGNLTISSGAILNTDSVSTVSLAGKLVINGTLNSFSSGSTVWTFNGSSTQTISAAVTFRSMVLNNSSGLILGGNLTIGNSNWGGLTLSSGKLTTGSYSVIIPQNCSGSMVTRSAGSWINGNQQLTMPAWGVSCVFDVGDSSNYSPITFSYAWHASPLGGTVTGGATGGDHPDTTTSTSGISASKSVNRYWTLTAGTGSTFYTYDAIFQYCSASGSSDCSVNDVDTGATASNFIVAEKSSGSWSSLTPTSPATSSRQVTGLATFGAFAIGEAGAVNTCPQPSNTPSGLTLTCQCDSFGRTSLNPSPMFTSSNWIVSTSDGTSVVPYINSSTGFLRLTEKTGNNAKAATVPGFFPAAGNYISVEFLHYAYNGSGADGIAVALSDYTISPVPGAYGGSLGYAQKTGTSGFAGGWIGVAVDEFGNYSNPTEGRVLGRGFIADGVAVRGSGSGQTGYPYLGGTTGSLSPGVDNASSTSPAYGHYYQIIVDARNSSSGQTWVAVNRDTSGAGSSYSSVVSSFDAYAASTAAGYTQAAVPANWQLSFTGSTGGSTNIHELGKVRVCAQYYVAPDGGTAGGFSAIDDAYTSAVQNFLTGHIYTKLAGTAFKLKVAALSNSQIQTTYAASGTKSVTVKLVDNSDGLCGTDSTRTTECAKSACNGKTAVSSQTLSFSSSDAGVKTTANFTVSKAYKNLVAVISDSTTTACSVDSFAVRPTSVSSVVSSATNSALTGSPVLKAGSGSFTLTATVDAGGYDGSLQFNTAAMGVKPTGGTVGSLSPTTFTATAGTTSSIASGSFTYSEVGGFNFLGYNPASDTTSARGIYDDSWTTVDSTSTKLDCVAGSYSNTINSAGKYGCLFGLYDTATSNANTPNSPWIGRFAPDHFTYVSGSLTAACTATATPYTYMGQAALAIVYRLEARNASNAITSNYDAALGYPVGTPSLVAEDQAAAYQGCELTSRLGGGPTSTWGGGVYSASGSSAVFSRPSTPVALSSATCSANRGSAGGPFWLLDVGVKMSDSDASLGSPDIDAVTSGTCSGTACTANRIGTTAVLDGRLWLNNAYGSEMLPLAMPVQAQYWSAAGWQKNSYDSCTSLTVPTAANGGLVFYGQTDRNQLSSGEVIAQMRGATTTPATLSAGDPLLILRSSTSSTLGPGQGNYGYVDVIGGVLGSPAWLPPTGNARACFGACGPRSPVIYQRERY